MVLNVKAVALAILRRAEGNQSSIEQGVDNPIELVGIAFRKEVYKEVLGLFLAEDDLSWKSSEELRAIRRRIETEVR